MQGLATKNKLYFTLLCFIPTLIINSWANVYLADYNYEPSVYLIRFILPSILIAYALSILVGEYFAKRFQFTFPKVFFAFFITLIVLPVIMKTIFPLDGTAYVNPFDFNSIIYSPLRSAINPCPVSFPKLCEISTENAAQVYITELLVSILFIACVYKLVSLVLPADKTKNNKRK